MLGRHSFVHAAAPPTARYVASVDMHDGEHTDERGTAVALRYRLGGTLRVEAIATSLQPLTPVDDTHDFLFRNGVAEQRFTLHDGIRTDIVVEHYP